MKLCSKCKTNKPVTAFGKNAVTKDKLHSYCKGCANAMGRSRSKEYRKSQHFKCMYKISLEDYYDMLAEQDHRCKICGSTKSGTSQHDNLVVDHDHVTGKVRGLLCDRCNRGLGYFRDDYTNMVMAAKYLLDSDTKS